MKFPDTLHGLSLSTCKILCIIFSLPASFSSDESLQTRIVGGEAVGQGIIPYQLYWTEKGFYVCGATLVQVYSIQVAITATHCLWTGYPTSSSIKNHQNILISAGDRTINDTDGREQRRKASKIVPYPGYEPKINPHDIAIMFLESDFDASPYVDPIILPDYNWDIPSSVEVSGWGSEAFGGTLQFFLQYVRMPTVDFTICNGFNRIPWVKITENQFCVGEIGGDKRIGSCSGDSGGPAAAFNETENRLYLAGIVSFGITLICGNPQYPTVYTRVSKYVDWIRMEVSKHLEGSTDIR